MARMASTCLEVDATIAEDAHRRRDLATLAAAASEASRSSCKPRSW